MSVPHYLMSYNMHNIIQGYYEVCRLATKFCTKS